MIINKLIIEKMNRFERMVALPEVEYHQLKALQQTQNPLENKFKTLSNEYAKQESIPDPYTRIQRQGETLNEMVEIKDQLRKRLISMTPKPFQTRAQGLFQFVKEKVKFNEMGELLNDDDTVIEGSNITDLIQHAVRDRRRNIVPTGWSHFLNILRSNNAPRMIMNYETLEDLTSPSKITSPKKVMTPTPIKFPLSKIGIKDETESVDSKSTLSTRKKMKPKRFDDYLVTSAKKRKYF